MKVIGLDPSLTSFGGAVATDDGAPPALFRWKAGSLTDEARMLHLVNCVEAAARGCDLAVVENTVGSRVLNVEAHLNLGGLHWAVRIRLYELGVPVAVVTPSLRMKYLTGKGRAEKDECLTTAVKRFGFLFPGHDDPDAPPVLDGNDKADALTLAAMGADHAGFPLCVMPAAQCAVLTSVVAATKRKPAHPAIRWPALAAA